jgi:serine/threonine protein kinase
MFSRDRSRTVEAPRIPDHTLVRCVGKGSYGEVWLAKSVMGTYRGVKIVYRHTFDHARPYEREFAGIQKFEPVSRTHSGLVSILHVGRNEPAGYFYYVMEVADDVVSGQKIDPENYTPKTLSSEIARRGKLPLADCLGISLSLTAALGHLHKQGLIHRDIKPSNIIFVQGAPKFADVGLVTEISESTTFVGTAGYMPPEGPGSPAGDLFSLGKVLYELLTGKDRQNFPELPTSLSDSSDAPRLFYLNEIMLKACEPDVRNRYQSADDMYNALALATPPAQTVPPARAPEQPARTAIRVGAPPSATTLGGSVPPVGLRVSILYKSGAAPDAHLLQWLEKELKQRGCEVCYDQRSSIGMEWARTIESQIHQADAVIVLLSPASVSSEMIAYEVEIAYQAAQQHQGRPRLLPIRIQPLTSLPSSLAGLLDPLPYLLWDSPADDERLLQELIRSLETSVKIAPAGARVKLESIGGAVPLESKFYVVRSTDREFQSAITRRDSIVLVKGARQMGKTSLLARGLQEARQSGAKVVLTDFQKLNASHLASIEAFFLTLAEFLADQLDLEVPAEELWDKRRSPNTNFERYLRREVLGKIAGHFVWGLDEVDRLFTCAFGGEVFGLFRSWHNERALDPSGPWSRLTLAIAYATEAHLFITDINQSPFNVGTRLTLEDFSLAQVTDLNERYGTPLRNGPEIRRFFELAGGQPYLVRRGLNEMASGHLSFENFAAQADRDEGIFGDHLRRILVLLARDSELTEVVRGILQQRPAPSGSNFYRLRSAGVMTGDSPQQVRPRCEIYASYLRQHFL